MTYETILIDRDPRGAATLTLNRPNKHNALNAQMIADLTGAASELAADSTIRAVILTGAGKSFCAGGDLGWMRDQQLVAARTPLATELICDEHGDAVVGDALAGSASGCSIVVQTIPYLDEGSETILPGEITRDRSAGMIYRYSIEGFAE